MAGPIKKNFFAASLRYVISECVLFLSLLALPPLSLLSPFFTELQDNLLRLEGDKGFKHKNFSVHFDSDPLLIEFDKSGKEHAEDVKRACSSEYIRLKAVVPNIHLDARPEPSKTVNNTNNNKQRRKYLQDPDLASTTTPCHGQYTRPSHFLRQKCGYF